jgi:hypothetical protein
MSLFVGSILYIYDVQIVGFGNLMKDSIDLSVSEKLHIAYQTMSDIRTVVISMEVISGILTGLMVLLAIYTLKRH